MNIIGMLPSEIERLKTAEPSPELEREILDAIGRLLSKGNSRDEAAFLAGVNLSKAGLERIVSPSQMAEVINDPTSPTARDFLQGLDPAFAGQVALKLLDTVATQVAVVPAGEPLRTTGTRYYEPSEEALMKFMRQAKRRSNWLVRNQSGRFNKASAVSITAAAEALFAMYSGIEAVEKRPNPKPHKLRIRSYKTTPR